jgi:hypothetical protein
MSDTSHGEDALTRGFLSTEVLFGWLRETRYSSQDLFALLEHMTRLELTSPGSSVAAVQLQSQKIRERVLDWIQEGSSLPQQEVRKYLNTRQWLRPQLTIWLRQNHTQNIFIENDPKLLKELKNLEIKNVHKWLEEWIAKNSDSPRAFERFYSSSKLFNILGQVLELLRLGASPEMRNRFGELPMHLALHLRNQELVELLIRYGGRLPSF